MTGRLPQVDKLVIPGQKAADLTEVVTGIAIDYTTDSVAELTIDLIDPKLKVVAAGSGLIGQRVTFAGKPWQVGGVEVTMIEAGAQMTLRCRDPLAKKLRATYKTSAEKKVAPSAWVRQRVTKAGGTAVVQPSSKRATIAQSKNQSELEVIADLAGELEWSWTSYDGTLLFASRFYAWQGKLPGLPSWKVTWKQSPKTDALSYSWSDSDDDTENRADVELELPYAYGAQMRPWHLIEATVPGGSGTFLIESVTITHDGVTPVQISATVPKKPSPKPGSSSEE